MGEARRLFDLFACHYEHVSWPRFRADLAEKDCVVLLRDSATRDVRGFSTQKVIPAVVQGRRIQALFSGDTIVDPAFWGDQELIRGWCRFAGAVRAADPGTPLYWLLISKGYRTYLYLPLFFTRYYPSATEPTPSFEQAVIDTLATEKFGACYRRASGTLEFPERIGNLTPALASVPPARQRDPRVRFFLERNPTYALEIYAHAIRPTRAGLVLHVRRIVIGQDVFVGAGTRIGPGVHIADGVRVPLLSDLYPHSRLERTAGPVGRAARLAS